MRGVPKAQGEDKQAAYQAWMDKGAAALAAGNYREATRAYSAASNLKPKVGKTYFLLGEAWRQRGWNTKSEEAYKEAIAHRYEEFSVYFGIALVEINQGKYEEAIDFLAKAHALEAKNVEPLLRQADCYLKLQRYREASKACRRALELDKNCVEALLTLTDINSLTHDFLDGLEGSKRLLEIDSEEPDFWARKAFFEEKLKRFPAALESYGQLLKREKDKVEILFKRSEIYEKLGNKKLALVDLANAYLLLGDYTRALLNLEKYTAEGGQATKPIYFKAIASEQLQDYEKALENYDLVVEADPEYAWAFLGRCLVRLELGKTIAAARDAYKCKDLADEAEQAKLSEYAEQLIEYIKEKRPLEQSPPKPSSSAAPQLPLRDLPFIDLALRLTAVSP